VDLLYCCRNPSVRLVPNSVAARRSWPVDIKTPSGSRLVDPGKLPDTPSGPFGLAHKIPSTG
jgi:hypothetical protein